MLKLKGVKVSKKMGLVKHLLVVAIVLLTFSPGFAGEYEQSFDCSIYDDDKKTYKNDPNFGCVCILCLSNPGGAFEIQECQRPMCHLKKMLEDGEPFPGCSMGCTDLDECKYVNINVVECIPCQETYGPGYKEYTGERVFDGSSGPYKRELKLCRKFLYYEEVEECKEEEFETGDGPQTDFRTVCNMVFRPIYDEELQQAVYAVKIMYQGKQLGQTFYFETAAKPGRRIMD